MCSVIKGKEEERRVEERKPTVLLVHNHYRIPGGEDSVVKNEEELLKTHGHRVHVYTRSNSEFDERGLFSRIRLLVDSVFSLKTYREIRKLIRENGVDIVHVHNTLSVISPSVYYAALSCGVPVVQTVHNFRLVCPGALLYRAGRVCEECLQHGPGRAVRYSCYRNSRMQTLISTLILQIHRMTGIYRRINYICLTPFNRDKLLSVNKKGREIFPGERVWIKPNFCLDIPGESLRQEGSVRKRQFLCVGRLEKEKGIDLLLEAWKEIKDYELLLCGTGTQEEWCRQFLIGNRMDNVRLLGQVSQAEVAALLEESQAMIFASRVYEGFPMTIVESFRSATPVIANDIGNGAALIKPGVNGLIFAQNSPEALRKIILSWEGGMNEGARKAYEKLYSPEKNYHRLFRIYRTVLQSG